MAWMLPWIEGYLGLGACAVLGNFLYLKYVGNPTAELLSASRRITSQPSLKSRATDALGFVFAFSFAAIFWPLLIVPEIKGRMQRRRLEKVADDPRLVANRANLVLPTDCAEVERLEAVRDPLGAAPALPFGHLNPAWQAFKTRLGEGDELWQFSALEPASPMTQADRWTRIAEGYAIVRNGIVVDEFVAHGGLLERSGQYLGQR